VVILRFHGGFRDYRDGRVLLDCQHACPGDAAANQLLANAGDVSASDKFANP